MLGNETFILLYPKLFKYPTRVTHLVISLKAIIWSLEKSLKEINKICKS